MICYLGKGNFYLLPLPLLKLMSPEVHSARKFKDDSTEDELLTDGLSTSDTKPSPDLL